MEKEATGVPLAGAQVPAGTCVSECEALLPARSRLVRHAAVWGVAALAAIVIAVLSIPFFMPVIRPGLAGPSVASSGQVYGQTVVVTQDLIDVKALPYATVEGFDGMPGLTLLGAWLDPVPAAAANSLPVPTSVDLSAISIDPSSVPPTGLPARVHSGTYALTMAWKLDDCSVAPPTASGKPTLELRNVFGTRIDVTDVYGDTLLGSTDWDAHARWCEIAQGQGR